MDLDKLSREPAEGTAERLEWQYCSLCNRLGPPRSWHCTKCDVCIVKRDHHCIFTGCCIGHLNHRYFLLLFLYLLIGLLYGMVYNIYVLYSFIQNNPLANIQKLFTVLDVYGQSPGYVFLFFPKFLSFIFSINVAAVVGVIMGLAYHLSNAIRGRVSIQGKKPILGYDNGLFNNLRSVFGERMYLAWLFPLIKSPLPEDGYSWKKTDIKTKTKQHQ